ncbi:hypothetical protein BSZ35_06635 [Salinibacter sp. 10B]|uniref:hypothetical protein n=1 Tax=Salinibacter sp. 10B TaxID=1923971 RepID=UPI000CF382D5|nr:hypothetical protein [Salinibacter sp. 10B]PQJ34317.1 hypothetical protein BSZ35_06635 [Salinibacter sp. 10B]
MIAVQTVSQMEAGVAFFVLEFIGPIGRFVVLAGLSLRVPASTLQQVPSRDQPPTDPLRRSNEPSDQTY